MIAFRPGRLGARVCAGVTGRPASFRPGTAGDTARVALAREIGTEPASLVFVHQVHGAAVVQAPLGAGAQADGIVTATPGVYLCISIADCCAVLVHDPVRSAVSALHAGWRGARDGIVARGIEAMERFRGSRPADLEVYLSPCAGKDRYVVREDVADHFPRSIGRSADGRLVLDLSGEIVLQLRDLGVPGPSIEASGVCTITDRRCHSHRRDGEAAGRMAAFIGLLP